MRLDRIERDSQCQKRRDIMFVRTAGSGDWTRTFTEEDQELFAERTGGLLDRLGYAARSRPGSPSST